MQFDAGPLITLKKDLDLEKLKENAFMGDQYTQLIRKIAENLIKKTEENNDIKEEKGVVDKGILEESDNERDVAFIEAMKKGLTERIAINWGADEKQQFNVVLGITLPFNATPKQIEERQKLYGDVFVAEKNLGGIVHDKLSKKDDKESSYKHKGGLSACIYVKKSPIDDKWIVHLIVSGRSTRQYFSQDYNQIAEMAWFYGFRNVPPQTKYQKAKNQFSGRQYNGAFPVERESITEITDLVLNTICNSVEDYYDCNVDRSDCLYSKYEDKWNKIFRYNKENLEDAFLTTMYIACGYNDEEEPGPFWDEFSDENIVFKTVTLALKHGLNIDFNRFPYQLKIILKNTWGQNDFSTTMLMFAAKKMDINPEKRLQLVRFLIASDADPLLQDSKGQNALSYARQAGNKIIEDYLRIFTPAQDSVKNTSSLLTWISNDKSTHSPSITQSNDTDYHV